MNGVHEAKQRVILVHGTFASSDVFEGEKWWQRGSAFCDSLSRKLHPGNSLIDAGDLFRWSGENSERARHEAAMNLLKDWLLPLERQGIDYHLVGHSHGGNIIREAMLRAEKGRTPLEHLRSWTTVGTPFLQINNTYKLRNSLFTYAIVCFIIISILLIPVTLKVINIVHYKQDEYNWVSNSRSTDHTITGVVANFFVSQFEFFLYDRSVAAYWLAIISLLAAVAVLWIFLITTMIPMRESFHVWRERKFFDSAGRRHRATWLGVWSWADEAINGLRHAVNLSGPIVPRRRWTSRRVFRSDSGNGLVPYILRIYGTVYNLAFAPRADRFVHKQLRLGVTGNDRPGSDVIGVAPWPFPELIDAGVRGLPEAIDERIVSASDSSASSIPARLRVLLAAQHAGDALSQLSHHLTFKELVHNSYFDDEDVVKIIAHHINGHATASRGEERDGEHHALLDAQTMAWYAGRMAREASLLV